jgi:hypothetical protein
MILGRLWQRGASLGLAVLVLVSSLTCMTVACRVVCAADQASAAKAAADLPPCHRAPGAADPAGPVSGPEGCGSGAVCCSTWIHDDESIRLAAPRPARAFEPAGEPLFASLPLEAGDPDMPFARDVGPDDPRPLDAPHLASRSSRAPPAA